MKTVLITGGSKGIGRAISLCLAKKKYNVVINYFHDDEHAERTLKECLVFNDSVIKVKGDISVAAEVQKMFLNIIDCFGSIDVVINNAGVNLDKSVLDLSEHEWDRVIDVNMKGVFLVSQAAAKTMLQLKIHGQIINISATTGITGRKNGLNYCASKAGVIVMTKCLAKELGPQIRVNCVIPGITRTPEIENRFNLKENEELEIEKRAIPLARIGETYEIADLISFLISEKASYLNGQKFIIDGGEYMY